MKLVKISIVLLAAIIIFFIIFHKPAQAPVAPLEQVVETSFDGQHCFARSQVATPEAPYSVSENINITISGTDVKGTKTGTQSGPDMSNGYIGTLGGTIDGNNLSLSYLYIVEGSKNIEEELYTISDNQIVKHRYPLLEEKDRLVPDLSQPATDIVYMAADCQGNQ